MSEQQRTLTYMRPWGGIPAPMGIKVYVRRSAVLDEDLSSIETRSVGTISVYVRDGYPEAHWYAITADQARQLIEALQNAVADATGSEATQ